MLLTRKHLRWSLFFIQNIAKFLSAPILKNICERLLLKMRSWNWEKLKISHLIRICNLHLKTDFFNINIRKSENICFILWFVSHEACIHLLRWPWRSTILFHHFFSSSSVFLQRSRISQIVFGILKQFSDMSDTSRKSEIDFVEISRSSWKFHTVLESLKQFLELSNSFPKY